MRILYRLPGMGWDLGRSVTLDELWDGSTFDYFTLVVSSQNEYDYLRSMELMRGEKLYDLALDPNFIRGFQVTQILIPLLDLSLA